MTAMARTGSGNGFIRDMRIGTRAMVGSEATSAWEVRACADLAACLVGGLDELREHPIVD